MDGSDSPSCARCLPLFLFSYLSPPVFGPLLTRIDRFQRMDTIGLCGSVGKIRISGRIVSLGELFRDEVGLMAFVFMQGRRMCSARSVAEGRIGAR